MLQVACPKCRSMCFFGANNPFRPFCSERCKGLDWSAWAFESYRLDAPPSSAGADSTTLGAGDLDEDAFCRNSSSEPRLN